MTDEEVTRLYQMLLGRDPEDAATIADFQRYYPTLERGRRAVFGSGEFAAFFARATGRTPQTRDHLAALLALNLLTRAAAAVPASPPTAQPDPALRAGMQVLFPAGAPPRLAVAVGEAGGLALDDLLPFADQEAAILHAAPGFPPAVPLTGSLEDGTTLFRLGGDADAVAGIVRSFGRPLDALCLLGAPAGPDWVEALRPHFAPRALLLVGAASATFDAWAVSAAVNASHPAEAVQPWRGLRLHHVGGWLLPVTYTPPDLSPAPPIRSLYPTLAIATIVRDEAVCVENMLRSTRPVASFYAVLDTGSTDATPELAQAYLSECGVAFAFAQRGHATFDDDFAAMRNAALAMVPDWVDWVLMLDADEALAPEDLAPLLELTAGAGHDAYALPRYNFPGADLRGTMISYPDRQVRLLRHTKDGHLCYSGAVHETVRGVSAGQPPLDASAMGGERGGPHIHHLVRRFRTAEQEERKQAFYRDVARRHGDRN